MPKAVKITLIVLGCLLLAGGAAFFVWRGFAPQAASVGIIGGADGPTAIFVTTNLAGVLRFALKGVGLLVVIVAFVVFWVKRRKNKK